MGKELKGAVRSAIGPFATPDLLIPVAGLPKTRSGKIMRRILRKVAAAEEDQLGDVTTLDTQIYTAAFKSDSGSQKINDGANVPRRNSGIAKMYTGGINKAHENGFKSKPADEFTNPRKHNMSTAMDKEGIRTAYNEVMEDKNGVDWAVFLFDGSKLGVTAKGDEFDNFKSHFGPDDRGFGYLKVMTGDEMSKRSKFVFCTWVGSNVSVMKKAKMSTDKALMKEIIQNLSVELQLESPSEISMDYFKTEVDKAGGARYGTGSQS